MSSMMAPGEVERELRRLQKELSPSEARAALFNLVVFADETTPNPSDDALAYLLGKRAARIIQIRQTGDAESSLMVSARCFPDRENRGVCFQEISIRNGADGAGIAQGTWAPLLIRDIPVFALWYDSLTDAAGIIDEMRDLVDKFIFDTAWNAAQGEERQRIFDFVYGSLIANGEGIADFAWSRILPLRRLTAEMFDGYTDALEHIARVELDGADAVTAHLYTLWLGSRLDWHWVDATSARSATGTPVTIEIGGDGADSGPADPESVCIRFVLDDESILSVTGEPGGCADVDVPGQDSVRYRYPNPRAGELLLAQVDFPGSDLVYAEAVRSFYSDSPKR